MKRFCCAACLVIFLITAVSCTVQPGVTATIQKPGVSSPTPAPVTLSAQPTATETAVPTPVAEIALQHTQYTLTANLDYSQRRLTVSESVSYSNRSTDVLPALVFVVEPNQKSGVFQLTATNWSDGSTVDGVAVEGGELTIPLKEPLQPGQTTQVDLSYTLDLPVEAGVLSFSDRQVNLSGWYPYLPPYLSDQGFVIHSPGAVGEYQVYELADYQVNLKVDGAPAGFTLAASAKATYDQGWYRFTQKGVRNFTWSGSSDYEVLEAYAGDVRVRAFVFPEHLAAGQASLDATVKALNLYAALYGPYEKDSLTVVEADFADGMEYDGLYFLGKEYFKAYKGDPASYLVALSAHETAHQWWFAMVGNDQALEPWLDEALCTYSERLFYENEYPDLVDWWWQTRVEAYSPQGWVDSSIYDFTAFRPYVNAVYLRGAVFLERLRSTMGDSDFFSFLSGDRFFRSVSDRLYYLVQWSVQPGCLSDPQVH